MSRLKEELTRRGWNARKLALTLGRNVPYTTKVVKGEAVATRPLIAAIGSALEIDVESFFDERRFAK